MNFSNHVIHEVSASYMQAKIFLASNLSFMNDRQDDLWCIWSFLSSYEFGFSPRIIHVYFVICFTQSIINGKKRRIESSN